MQHDPATLHERCERLGDELLTNRALLVALGEGLVAGRVGRLLGALPGTPGPLVPRAAGRRVARLTETSSVAAERYRCAGPSGHPLGGDGHPEVVVDSASTRPGQDGVGPGQLLDEPVGTVAVGPGYRLLVVPVELGD